VQVDTGDAAAALIEGVVRLLTSETGTIVA